MFIRNYTFNKTIITAMTVDTTNNNYLWIAFAKNSSNVCILQKVSANNLSQVYYEIELSTDQITDIHVFSSYIYVTVSDATNLFYKISLSSPLTVQTAVVIPSGINEDPLAIVDDGSYLYILFPGNISGEYSKICKYDTTPSFIETIDLATITNAIGLTSLGTDLWIATSESPSNLVRVYEISGGIYTYTTTSLL